MHQFNSLLSPLIIWFNYTEPKLTVVLGFWITHSVVTKEQYSCSIPCNICSSFDFWRWNIIQTTKHLLIIPNITMSSYITILETVIISTLSPFSQSCSPSLAPAPLIQEKKHFYEQWWQLMLIRSLNDE